MFLCSKLTFIYFIIIFKSSAMSLIEEYYELNEAEEVSVIWKIMQLIFYSLAACLGLWCGCTIALLRLKFEDKCYLFTAVKFWTLQDKQFDTANINWGSDSWCDYCQYSMVSSFIVAIIWATFFLMCGKGGKSLTGLPQPWRIVWPSLIFNFIYFIVSLSTAINIQQGTDQFCCRRDFDKGLQTKSLAENCKPLKYLLKENVYDTLLQIEIVSKTSWACTVSWFILFLLSFFRIIFVTDFHLYKVCVFKIGDTAQNKKEEVLRITNYEEPKKLQFREESSKKIMYTFENNLDDFEEERKKRFKVNKRSVRDYFNTANQSPMQPNTAFYVTADIRMLNREKKTKTISKSLDKTIEKSTSNKMREIRKINTTVDLQEKINEFQNTSNRKHLFHQESYTEDSYASEDETESISPKSFDLRSGPETSAFKSNFPINRSIRFKKFV